MADLLSEWDAGLYVGNKKSRTFGAKEMAVVQASAAKVVASTIFHLVTLGILKIETGTKPERKILCSSITQFDG